MLLTIVPPPPANLSNLATVVPMSKCVVILQSNYIPWKGYFDLVNAADEFWIFDDVQFTRRDWRNRNKIIVNGQPTWLTIPVMSKGQFLSRILDMEVADPDWAAKHWRSIRHAYAKAPYLADYESTLVGLYESASRLTRLTEINELFLTRIAALLGIEARFRRAETIAREADTPTGRLVEICKASGADMYVSGPAAKSYIDTRQFEDAGIALRYCDYSGYPTYDQGTETFEHGVSIVDMLLRIGPQTVTHLKSRPDRERFLEP